MKNDVLMSLLSTYEDEVWDYVKIKIRDLQPEMCRVKDNQLVEVMMSVLMEDSIRIKINREQLAGILQSFFLDELEKKNWQLLYLDRLYSSICGAKQKPMVADRAAGYAERIRDNINEAKKKADWTKDDDKSIEVLEDCLKFTLGIYIQMTSETTVDDPVRSISFDFDERDVERLTRTFYLQEREAEVESDYSEISDQKIKFPRVINNIGNAARKAAIDRVEETRMDHDQKNERKMFHRVLTWMIFYKICQEDGIELGER